jgi:hypothetical protein
VIGAGAASTSDGHPPSPQKNVVASADGREGGLGALPLAARTRRGGATRTGEPACLPAVRLSLRHLWRVTRTRRKPEIVGALEAQGLHRAEQISLCWLHRRRAESDAGNEIKLPPRYASVGSRSSRRRRRFADRRRGKASLRRRDDAVVKFFPVRRLHNLFLLSAHGHEVIMPACGDAKETKRS